MGYNRTKVRKMVGMNWRSRPLGGCRLFGAGRIPRPMSPVSPGRVVPLRDIRTGNQAASDAEQVRPDRKLRTTSREAESREVLQVESRTSANTVGPRPIVATVSQCGGNGIPRLGTNQKAAKSAGVATGKGQKGIHPSRAETSRWKAPGRAMTRTRSIRSEHAGGSGNGVVRLGMKTQREG